MTPSTPPFHIDDPPGGASPPTDAQDLDALRAANIRWARSIMARGVLVTLTIGRWTGHTQLTPEDLGIEVWQDIEDQEVQVAVRDSVRLGFRRLLPKRILDTLDSLTVQARRNLDQHAYSTPWGHFVPALAYPHWKTRNAELGRRYLAVRDEVVEKLPHIKAELRENFALQAHVAWRRAQGLPAAGDDLAPDDFVQAYVGRLLAAIPDAETLHRSFRFEVALSPVPLLFLWEGDRPHLERLWPEASPDLSAEQREAIREMQADLRRYYAEQAPQMIETFLRNLVVRFRTHVYDAVVNVLRSIQTNDGRLVGKASQQLRNLVRWTAMMNVYDDQEVARALGHAQAELDLPPPERDIGALAQMLWALAVVAAATLTALDAPPEPAEDADIPDEPTPNLVSEARGILGTNILPELPIVHLAVARNH